VIGDCQIVQDLLSMSIEVKIPAVGESITSGVLSTWHKQNGDVVNDGEALFTLDWPGSRSAGGRRQDAKGEW
jgi:hypothetical protein